MNMNLNLIGRGLNGIVAVAALWEILSPFILGYSDQTYVVRNGVIVGIFLLLVSIIGTLNESESVDSYMDIFSFAIGLWLIIAPFVYGFNAIPLAAAISSIVTGIVIAGASVAAYYEFWRDMRHLA